MTSTTASTASQAPDRARHATERGDHADRSDHAGRTDYGDHVAGRQTFARAIRCEWVKLRTLRSTWVTSMIAAVVIVLFSASLCIAYANRTEEADMAAEMIGFGSPFGQIVAAVLGALIVTGEYSSGQIRSSLSAVPRRGRLFLAKAIVVATFSFALGSLSLLAAWAVSLPFMKGHAQSLTDSHYLGFFWGTGLAFAGVALLALGLGYIMRSTAGAITGAMVVLFVLDVPVQVMSLRWDWALKIQGLLPLNVSGAVSDPFSLMTLNHTWGQSGTDMYLEHGQAVLVFCLWFLVPFVAGLISFLRRDA